MDPFNTAGSYWDLAAQQPSNFSTLADDDFLALLQKQFPSTLGATPSPKPPFDLSSLTSIPPDGGVDPQSITTFPLPNPSPPSSDSSPSPPSMHNDPPSRPRSGVFNNDDNDDHTLKRKASDESMDDEPSHKNPHGASSSHSRKPSGSARRKSGNPHQDEVRLLKRKEQNRAAQRAFRERKEKHVKDLEDKVAALEAVNQEKQNENDNLRDLLSRLQSENMALKQSSTISPSSAQSPSGQFTFSVPKPSHSGMQMNMSSLHALSSYMTPHPPPQSMLSPPTSFASPSSVSSSSSGPSASMSPPNNSFDFNFGQLIPFDPASLSALDEPVSANTPTGNGVPQTATDGAMSIDYGFGPMSGGLPYKTIASNPMFMSFGEPMDTGTTTSSPYTEWNTPAIAMQEANGLNGGVDSLDQLFGGNYMGAQSPVDFSALLRSPPSSVAGLGAGSPIAHAQSQPSHSLFATLQSSASTPGASSSSSSGPSGSSSTDSPNPATPSANDLSCEVLGPSLTSQPPATNHGMSPTMMVNGVEHKTDQCPRTKDEMRQMIIQRGTSAFVNPSSAPSAAGSPHSPPITTPSSMTTSPTPAPLSPSSIGALGTANGNAPLGANIGFVRKSNNGEANGNVVMCKGSSFPKTQMSDKNIEVLTAWRTITSNPQFKDVDINELCTEFTSKARCDGTKVVLEPDGVNHIMQTLAARRMGQGQGQGQSPSQQN